MIEREHEFLCFSHESHQKPKQTPDMSKSIWQNYSYKSIQTAEIFKIEITFLGNI
jgi:hypothetical protein